MGTFDDVGSVAVDMRQRAAITGEFKPNSSGPFFVVEIQVQKALNSNVGFAGAQVSKEKLADGSVTTLNSILRGGASQAEFLIPPAERTQYLRPVTPPKRMGN